MNDERVFDPRAGEDSFGFFGRIWHEVREERAQERPRIAIVARARRAILVALLLDALLKYIR